MALVLLLLAVVAGWPFRAAAQAPLEPVERQPLPGLVLRLPPVEVRLRFPLPLATPLESSSFVAVYDRRGERVDLGPAPATSLATTATDTLATRLGPLNPGIYTVRWRATAAGNGGSADGSYSFALAPREGSESWAPLLAIGIAGVLVGMAIGAWLTRLRLPESTR